MFKYLNLVLQLVDFLTKAIAAYLETEAGKKEAQDILNAWDELDGVDNVPDDLFTNQGLASVFKSAQSDVSQASNQPPVYPEGKPGKSARYIPKAERK